MPQAIIAAIPYVAGAAAVSAPSVIQASESNVARKSTKSAMEEQQRQQDAYLASIEEESASSDKIAVRDKARTLQRQKAAAAQGRRSTILTSPLGTTGTGATNRKTLLGS